jgi:DNA-directed RNA polymerase II subunit RPB7
MFFILNLKKNLQVTPEYLGKKLSTHLLALLKRAVEGSFNNRFGYLVKVLTVDKYGEGKVQDGSGDVMFQLSYKALVFMPYKGEVVDAVVTQVMEVGFMAAVGPLGLFVSSDKILDRYRLELDAKPHARWANTQDSTCHIQISTDVRLKIIGIRVIGNEMIGVCEMAENYLGPVKVR